MLDGVDLSPLLFESEPLPELQCFCEIIMNPERLDRLPRIILCELHLMSSVSGTGGIERPGRRVISGRGWKEMRCRIVLEQEIGGGGTKLSCAAGTLVDEQPVPLREVSIA